MLLADMSNMEVIKEHSSISTKSDGTLKSQNKTEISSIVDLKNGKVVFRQKPLPCEKMSETMQETVNFRAFLGKRAKEENSTLEAIPEEHIPLIAKLAHESDKTISFLAKHIQESLRPEDVDGDATYNVPPSLTIVAVESAILRVCTRVNYGIDWTEKTTTAASIWRWEVREQFYYMLPKSSREKFETRLAQRRQAKQYLMDLYNALSQSEKDLFSKSGKKAKQDTQKLHEANDENFPTAPVEDNQTDMKPSTPIDNVVEAKKLVGRPKKDKVIDPDQLAKEKEKAEKKAAKEEKERKQQEAETKSRTIMTSFFSKPKANSSKLLKPAASSSINKSESSSQSEFERTFKPFILRKGATLAPINYFQEQGSAKEVILIDEDKIDPSTKPVTREDQKAGTQEHFAEFSRNASSRRMKKMKNLNPNGAKYKSSSAYCVRDVLARLSEAEVLGDDSGVRRLQALLRSRKAIPGKVLIFHEDYRPGYFGTFTKSSTAVGPRTPFATDPIAFDYSYDSGEDWEEEDENADDLLSLGGSDVEKWSDVDADEFDGWLVDDDEPVDPGTPLSERAGSPGFPIPQDPQFKRKNVTKGETRDSKEAKKRKVMPLVPFSKGPCLEDDIGECDYEPFKQYRIQLFNDTPFPVNPFTFVAAPVVIQRESPVKQVFAVPALPSRIQPSAPAAPSSEPMTGQATSVVTTTSSVASSTTVQRTPVQPKNPFPPALLPYFADKVASLNSGNLTWLVESLYQDLRPHRVRKNAIEAKVREDCEKCPTRKIWVVKEDVLRSLGRNPVPAVPPA